MKKKLPVPVNMTEPRRDAVARVCCPELEFPGHPYGLSVLKVGYCEPQEDHTWRADCTVSLLTGPSTVLVDTGGSWGRELLQTRLKEKGLEPGDVRFVVGTHGHSDHIGNLSLFPSATTIVGYDVNEGDRYLPNRLAEGQAYSIDEYVSVVPTPGHTGQDVSVQVKGLLAGTALVAGDLFERWDDEDCWRGLSMDATLQEANRQKALQSVDVIVPGHGRPFRVLRS